MEQDKGNKEVVAVCRNKLMLEHLFLIGQPDAPGVSLHPAQNDWQGCHSTSSEWLTGVSLQLTDIGVIPSGQVYRKGVTPNSSKHR